MMANGRGANSDRTAISPGPFSNSVHKQMTKRCFPHQLLFQFPNDFISGNFLNPADSTQFCLQGRVYPNLKEKPLICGRWIHLVHVNSGAKQLLCILATQIVNPNYLQNGKDL